MHAAKLFGGLSLMTSLLLVAYTVLPASADTTAIIDATVLTMTGSETRTRQTVLVENGHIVRIGSTAEVDVPPEAVSIQATDQVLIPGLVDSHVHLEHFDDETQLQLFIQHGVTSVRNMDGRDHVLEWRQRQASGLLTGPTIVTTGPLLDGSPPLWDDSVVIASRDDARREVTRIARAGYDQVKVYDRLSAEALDGIVAAARENGLKVVGHVPYRVGLEATLAAGLDSIEHLTGYGDHVEKTGSIFEGSWHPHKRFLSAIVPDTAKITSAVELTRAAGVWNCPTLVMHERSFASEDAKLDWRNWPSRNQLSLKRYLVWFILTFIDRESASAEAVASARTLRYSLVEQIAAAGAGLLLGTDAGIPFVFPGASAHAELRLMVDAGLSPYQALETATANAAKFLELNTGSIAPGRRADLVLLEANPLDDIDNTRRIVGVMVQGTWYDQEAIQAMAERVRW